MFVFLSASVFLPPQNDSSNINMWKCKRCKKPVYFAEKRKSMGFEWHRQCLKCEECGKILNPGQHAEHKEIPYCHIPCYSALFGPKLFGHGSTVESHQSFGKRTGTLVLQEQELFKKVKLYNDYMENNKTQRLILTSREVNGRLVLEGVLRIFWGLHHSIRVKEEHDLRPIIMRKKSSKGAIDNEESGQKSEQNYYRHSVHLFGISKEFESFTDQKAEDILRHSILCRTLSDSKLDAFTNDLITPYENNDHKTLPANIITRKPSFLQFRLDRFETSLNLPKENHIKITENKVLTGSLENDKENNVPNFSCEENTRDKNNQIENKNSSNHHDNNKNNNPGNGNADNNENNNKDDIEEITEIDNKPLKKSTGPRALKRGKKLHGKKLTKSGGLQRRKSFNGHWYDRETSVFTPPKNSSMSIWVTSLLTTSEILNMILEKYQITSDQENYGLFLVKDSGERRLVQKHEFPLMLQVKIGPHEDVAKFQVMELKFTSEIRQEVAEFLRFSYTELRAIVDMFYEEEEREIERIKRKYRLMRRCIRNMMNRHKETREDNHLHQISVG